MRDKLDRQLAIFERMITGARRGEAVSVVAEDDSEYIEPASPRAPKMITPRQLVQARGVMFCYREAYRQAQSVAAAEARRTCCDDGKAHQWKPNRPARPRRAAVVTTD